MGSGVAFVSELRRRQVFRAAAWYGGLAWLAVEVADTVFPQFGLPDWSVRAVIVAAVLGLPVVLALAWWFDLSGAGLRRDPAAAIQQPSGAAPGPRGGDALDPMAAAASPAHFARIWRIPSFWIALALGAGLAVSAQHAWQQLVHPAFGERPGLAVLPFANLSPDPENAYFADGLHEEILATLARAGGLRVISRTSVQQFRDAQRNLREIADALDPSLILEGSVRRNGDDVRLTVQLIDGRTDEHLWAETYDRKFRDALELQRAVAQQVVAAIGAKLSPTEEQLIARAAPTVPEAHDRYLHALALSQGMYATAEELKLAERLLGEVIALEPGFALAHALRAKVRIWMYTSEPPDVAAPREGARADIEHALKLQPDLPDAYVARGLYHTYVTLDPERALVDLERALKVLPNDADTQLTAALTLRRLGRFDEAVSHFEHAALLSPGQWQHTMEFAGTLAMLGRHEAAERAFEAGVRRHPAVPALRLLRRFNRFLATGETAGWLEEYEKLASPTGERFPFEFNAHILFLCTGDLARLIDLQESLAAAKEQYVPETPDFMLGLAHTVDGDPDRARPYLEATAADMARHPGDGYALAFGAIALELLGRTTEAVRAADEAIQALPESRDAVNGPSIAILRAWVLIRSRARAEEGYAELDRLVGTFDLPPLWVAVQLPWLILRDDARAQRIIRDRFPEA